MKDPDRTDRATVGEAVGLVPVANLDEVELKLAAALARHAEDAHAIEEIQALLDAERSASRAARDKAHHADGERAMAVAEAVRAKGREEALKRELGAAQAVLDEARARAVAAEEKQRRAWQAKCEAEKRKVTEADALERVLEMAIPSMNPDDMTALETLLATLANTRHVVWMPNVPMQAIPAEPPCAP